VLGISKKPQELKQKDIRKLSESPAPEELGTQVMGQMIGGI
jgi:hypothetical protein